MKCTSFGLAALALAVPACGFYLPGVAPRDFAEGETVDLKVNALESSKTQIPFGYYMPRAFCAPTAIEDTRENLGEVLTGNRIENSPYDIYMAQNEACKVLCKVEMNAKSTKVLRFLVSNGYRVNWIVDNLPAATKFYVEAEAEDKVAFQDGDVKFTERYQKGFDLGFMGDEDIPHTFEGQAYVHNHHRIVLYHHLVGEATGPGKASDGKSDTEPAASDDVATLPKPEVKEGGPSYRIVGFEVEPFSVKHQVKGDWRGKSTKLDTCTPAKPVTRNAPPQSITDTEKEIIYTYDVEWRSSDVRWASRWDLYLKMSDSQIHWFSIVNSLVIVVFLAAMVGIILVRTLNRDMRKYNEILEMTEEEQQEETGWKLIHGDVFRPPSYGGLLSAIFGTGCQIIAMSVVTILFAAFGFLSPANRGGLMTAFVVIFVCMGFVAGYFATRTYTMFKLQDWKKNSILTATLVPGIFFAVFFILNLLLWGEESTGAIPFTTMLAVLALWGCISVPLVYLGSSLAASRDPIEPPLRVNNIPRGVNDDDVSWYNGPAATALMAGVLPFGAVFIELFFIMSSVWLHQFYYVFGFLLLVMLILVITCAEVSICMCYFQLISEDYHWQWRSFFNSGCSAFYLFVYSIVYFCTKLHIDNPVSATLYFGYMFLTSVAFFIMTGSIGYISCYYFVRKIYMSIKID